MNNPEAIARLKLSLRPTKDLIRDFILTGAIHDPHIPTVRGWIMDELERRDPEGYDNWIENYNDDRDLLKCIHC